MDVARQAGMSSEAAPAAALRAPAAPRASLGGRGWAALLVGLASLGLPWGPLGQPGYVTASRVPVALAGVLVVLGWRRGSRQLVRVGSALGLAAVVLAGFQGGGALALLLALLLLEVPLRRP